IASWMGAPARHACLRVLLGYCQLRRYISGRLQGQTLAALTAARIDNGTATTGGHAFAKPMHSHPLRIRRLECTLHLSRLLWVQMPPMTKEGESPRPQKHNKRTMPDRHS